MEESGILSLFKRNPKWALSVANILDAVQHVRQTAVVRGDTMSDSLVGYPFLFAAVMPLISAQLLKLSEKILMQPAAKSGAQQAISGLGWAVDLTQVVAVSFLPVVTLLFAVPVSVASLVTLGAEAIFAIIALILMLNDGPVAYGKRKWLRLTPITFAGLLLNGAIGLALIIHYTNPGHL